MSCTPVKYNMKPRVRGDTWPGIIFTVEVNEAAADFDGASVSMGFKKNIRGSTLDLLLTDSDGDIDITDNVITVLPRVLNLFPGDYAYDLQVKYADGKVQTLVGGVLTVKSDVTP